MTTTALNALWTYLQSLSLTPQNREWLAGKLVDPSQQVSQEDTEATLWKEYCATFSAERDAAVMEQFKVDAAQGRASQDCLSEEQVFEQLGI